MEELLDRILEKISLKKEWLIGGVVACTLLLGGSIWLYRQRQSTSELVSPLAEWEEPAAVSNEGDGSKKEVGEPTEVFVDVKGAVASPGVYRLKAGDRVQDAVRAAGDFLDTADERAVNLAAKVADEMCLYVPEVGEEVPGTAATVAGSVSAAHEEAGAKSALVNINAADKEELKTLQGIGDVKAENILSYREENGAFKSIEEIKKVSGIGDGIFETLKDAITVD